MRSIPLTFIPDPCLPTFMAVALMGLRVRAPVSGFSRIPWGLSCLPGDVQEYGGVGLAWDRGGLPMGLTFSRLTSTYPVPRHMGFVARSCLSMQGRTHEGVKRTRPNPGIK